MPRTQKEERLHIRATVHQKNIIARAAEIKGVTITNFMLEAAYKAASDLTLDQTEQRITADQWSIIQNALSAPPKEIAALAKMAQKYGHLLEEPFSKQKARKGFASLSNDSNDNKNQVTQVARQSTETNCSSGASVTYERKSAIKA